MERKRKTKRGATISASEETKLISPQVLDKIYNHWKLKNYPSTYNTLPMSYQRIQRRSSYAQSFENWLFENGCSVIQTNRIRYLTISNSKKGMFFLLSWA